MSDPKTRAMVSHTLDPSDGRALLQAIDRLPVQAIPAGDDPLTPSLRSVLDRFLSVPLRQLLRSLGPIDGPAAVLLDGLTVDGVRLDGLTVDGVAAVGPFGREHDRSRPGLVPAMVAWLAEAAGLFPVEPSDGPEPWSDYRMLWSPAVPPADAVPLLLSPVNHAIDRLDPSARRLVNDRRFRPAIEPAPGTRPTASVLVAGLAPTAGLVADPDDMVGVDDEAEAARHRLLDALDAVGVDIEPRPGRLVLADGRRGHLRLHAAAAVGAASASGGWRERVALTADPRATQQS